MTTSRLLTVTLLVATSLACSNAQGPAPAATGSTIYKWIDENGIAHYTTDRERIPERLRERIPTRDSAPRPSAAAPTRPAPATATASSPRAAAAAESWITRDRVPVPEARTDSPAASDLAARGRARADLDAQITALEAEIAADEEALKNRLGSPGAGGFTLTADAELRSIAERLPRRLADLRDLQEQRGQLEPALESR